MSEKTYLDFDLHIRRDGDTYSAQVLNSPAGQASVEFEPPLSDLEMENFLLRVGRPRRGVRRLESPEMEAARTFGASLFDAVFDGQVRSALRRSLDRAASQDQGLRIRLHLDTPELVDIPWEYLYDTTADHFLSLSRETPIVRYLDLPDHIPPLPIEPPLKVLVMISSPTDYPPLDVEREWRKLKEASSDLETQGLLELERLPGASLAALQRQLRRGEYHIFHCVGHGTFDEQSQDGVLLLESDSGRGRSVSGRDLGTILYDHRSLRLALLNACEGARTSRSDPFAGVAHSLVQKRIPAVIAMQFEITDDAAITLAHAFYTALVDGYPVDAALAEARKAIFAQENDVEWGTPVLYLSAKDGRVFAVERLSEKDRRQRRIDALLLEAQAAATIQDWATAAEKYQAVLALQPDHAEAVARLNDIRQQQQLSLLYDRGVKHFQAGRWQEATHYLQQVQGIDPTYRDVNTLLLSAARQMAQSPAKPEQAAKPQSRRWLWAAIPAFILLLVIAGLGGYVIFGPGGTSTPEPPVVVDGPTPTFIPGPTSASAVASLSATEVAATATAAWAAGDEDGDGLTNGNEVSRNLNPYSEDTDGDGLPDGSDPAPASTSTHTPVSPTATQIKESPTAMRTQVSPTATQGKESPTATLTQVSPTATRTRVPTQVPPSAAPGYVTDFEQPLTWRRGDQPYGTFTRSSERVASGAKAGRLDYDLPAVSTNFVVFELRPSAALPGSPGSIEAQVYGDESGHFLNVWLEDSCGEIRSYTFGQIEHDGWKTLIAWFDDGAGWPNVSISGPDNGVLDYPAVFHALVLDGVPDRQASSGTIYIDELKIAESASPAPTVKPTMAPTKQAPPALSGLIAFPVFDAARGAYDIYVANPDGGNLKRLRNDASQPAFGPGGQRIAFRNWRHDERGLSVINADGSSHQRLTRFFEDGLPSWSPDAKTLVFLSRRHGDRNTRLYQVPSSGSDEWDMDEQVFGEYPTWMPDGRIIFRATQPEHGLVAINADGSGSTMVFKDTTVTAPAASPDGKYVAFMSQKDGGWEIYQMKPDGSGVKRLTNNGARDGLPAWAPDSKALAFVSDRDGAWAMWVMSADGSNQRKLFALPGSPDGFVSSEPDYSSRGWVEERVSWGR